MKTIIIAISGGRKIVHIVGKAPRLSGVMPGCRATLKCGPKTNIQNSIMSTSQSSWRDLECEVKPTVPSMYKDDNVFHSVGN